MLARLYMVGAPDGVGFMVGPGLGAAEGVLDGPAVGMYVGAQLGVVLAIIVGWGDLEGYAVLLLFILR